MRNLKTRTWCKIAVIVSAMTLAAMAPSIALAWCGEGRMTGGGSVCYTPGGCVETTHETTHADPVYVVHDVVHYAVGNIPGAVPHTSTYALTNATLPFVLELAELGVRAAVERDAALRAGVSTVAGRVTNAAVAEALGRTPADPLTCLAA